MDSALYPYKVSIDQKQDCKILSNRYNEDKHTVEKDISHALSHTECDNAILTDDPIIDTQTSLTNKH